MSKQFSKTYAANTQRNYDHESIQQEESNSPQPNPWNNSNSPQILLTCHTRTNKHARTSSKRPNLVEYSWPWWILLFQSVPYTLMISNVSSSPPPQPSLHPSKNLQHDAFQNPRHTTQGAWPAAHRRSLRKCSRFSRHLQVSAWSKPCNSCRGWRFRVGGRRVVFRSPLKVKKTNKWPSVKSFHNHPSSHTTTHGRVNGPPSPSSSANTIPLPAKERRAGR